MKELTRDDVLQAARDGRLTQNKDDATRWYEIDGKRINLQPVVDLLSEGAIALSLNSNKVAVR